MIGWVVDICSSETDYRYTDLIDKDFNTFSLNIQKGETINLDIRNYFSTFSTSMNFRSNNPFITLPGFKESDYNGRYLKEAGKIQHHKFFNQNNHIFIL